MKKGKKVPFKTVCYRINSEKLPLEFYGFRIIHLSDLHGAVYGRNHNMLLHKIHEVKPNLVVMTGDLADGSRGGMLSFIKLTEALCGYYPLYYIPGNHEQELEREIYDKLIRKLQHRGVTVLNNKWCTISRRGSFIKIYGLVTPMVYYKDPMREGYERGICFTAENTRELLGEADESCYNLLLAHNPLYFPSYRDWGADLTLSGHIHGGIIRIPGLGGLLSPDVSFFPKYDGGHFEEKGKHLIVSRGLGNHFLVRICNPPELVVITLCAPALLHSSEKIS